MLFLFYFLFFKYKINNIKKIKNIEILSLNKLCE